MQLDQGKNPVTEFCENSNKYPVSTEVVPLLNQLRDYQVPNKVFV